MHKTLNFEQKAMATIFEGWLCGEDLGHLRSVAQELQREILRIEQLLSRYDPSAELYRLNATKAKQPIKIEKELWEVLENCLEWNTRTDGYFDIGVNSKIKDYPGLSKAMKLSDKKPQVEFQLPEITLDLGGYGKGYALDKLGEILHEFGIQDFLIHGGGSSFLTQGKKANGKNWEVHLLDEAPTQKHNLIGGFSFSALHDKLRGISDIVHAQTGNTLKAPLSCAVFAPTALEAEVLSTALLAMGKEKGEAFILRKFPHLKVHYIEKLPHEA